MPPETKLLLRIYDEVKEIRARLDRLGR
jgi:hypothetical protein